MRTEHVEHRLRLVRQLFYLVQAEKSAATFNGVRGAEDLVHQLGVGSIAGLFDGQQVGLDGGQVLPRLADESLQEFIVKHEAVVTHSPAPDRDAR
ncbi:MAG: hypothetical protein WA655_17065 [Candidatus Korobacteraceae bacterium]